MSINLAVVSVERPLASDGRTPLPARRRHLAGRKASQAARRGFTSICNVPGARGASPHQPEQGLRSSPGRTRYMKRAAPPRLLGLGEGCSRPRVPARRVAPSRPRGRRLRPGGAGASTARWSACQRGVGVGRARLVEGRGHGVRDVIVVRRGGRGQRRPPVQRPAPPPAFVRRAGQRERGHPAPCS